MKKKRYIVLLIMIFLLLVIMYIFVGRDNILKEKNKMTLIVGNKTVFLYEHNKWVVKNSTDDISWEKFILYDNNIKLGTYQTWKDTDKWLFFDEEKNEVETSGKILAYQSNFNIKVDEYKEEIIQENDNNIDYVLKDNNISLNTNFTSKYKIELDYDKDNQIETFYIISNAFSERINNEKYFSIAFMIKNNKLYYLYKSINTSEDYTYGCLPYYNYFVDLNDDSTDEIIISCGKYSNNNTIDTLYSFENDKNKFKTLVSNQ